MVTSQGLGYAFPYSLLCLGMRANNPRMELEVAPFLLSGLLYTAACTALTVRRIRHRDVMAE